MRLRDDSEASLFGFDQANHVYIHETTHRSIRELWEKLVQMRISGRDGTPARSAPADARVRASVPRTERGHRGALIGFFEIWPCPNDVGSAGAKTTNYEIKGMSIKLVGVALACTSRQRVWRRRNGLARCGS